MTKTTHTTKKSSVTPPQVEPSSPALQQRPFPQETASKDEQSAAPTPISADWRAQQETVARARFNPDRISLYPIDPVKEERREKPIQKKAEPTAEQDTTEAPEAEEKDKPIQKKAETTPEQEPEQTPEEKDKPIQKKADETPAEQDAEATKDTAEKAPPLQKKAEETAPEKEPEQQPDEPDQAVQKTADEPTSDQGVKPEAESDEKDKAVQKKADEPIAEQSPDKEQAIQKKADTAAEPSSTAEKNSEESDKTLQKKPETTSEADEDKAEPIQRKAESESAEEPEKQDDPVANKPVQTKLTVGKVGDRYEQEADQVAAKVMTMPDPAQNRIQRQPHAAPADLQPKPLASAITPFVQQKAAGADIPGKEPQKHTSSPDSNFEARLSSSMAGGTPLPDDVRSFMESRLGVGLKPVKTHTGPAAAQLTKELRAQAFTYRHHIFYASGKAPAKDELTAHELTHVIQQTGGQKLNKETVRRSPDSQNQEANQPKALESTEAQDNKLTPAESSIQRHGISMVSPQLQLQDDEFLHDPLGWTMDRGREAKDKGEELLNEGVELVGDALEAAKERLLEPVANLATNIPGYPMLTVILGKDPIKDKPVERNATNVVRGIITLVPGGEKLFQDLQESGALQKAFDWFEEELRKLNITWTAIKELFRNAWDGVRGNLVNPEAAFNHIRSVFEDPIRRIRDFALSVGQKVMELIFEGAMKLAGKGGADQVMGILKKVGGLFMKIVKDPVGFVGNLVKSVKGGFENFSANIMTHLKAGLMGWLFGTLSGSGLQMPAALNLKGMLSIALQVAGATYQKLRKKLVKRMGEKKVSQTEKSFALLRSIASGGLIAAWKQISQSTGDVKEMVISEVRNWVITTIIKKAVIKLVSMFNPAGAVVQAVIAVYNTVMFFIERMQQIIELANAVFNSINSIAAGKIKAAIKFVEQSMAKSLPVIISFMARLLGLGGISKKIHNIIKKVQKPIDRAISRLVEMIIKATRKISKTKDKKSKGNDNVKVLVQKYLAKKLPKKVTSKDGLKNLIRDTYKKYKKKGLKSLSIEEASKKTGRINIVATASPRKVVGNSSVPIRFTPQDLKAAKWNKVTLYASVNGHPINQRFRSRNGVHAETKLINYLNKHWNSLTGKHYGPNVLTVQITSSPCGKDSNNCANNLIDFTKAKNTFLVLQTLGVYKGIFHGSSVDALEELHGQTNGILLETWDEDQAINQLKSGYGINITNEIEQLVRSKIRETQIAFRLFE